MGVAHEHILIISGTMNYVYILALQGEPVILNMFSTAC